MVIKNVIDVIDDNKSKSKESFDKSELINFPTSTKFTKASETSKTNYLNILSSRFYLFFFKQQIYKQEFKQEHLYPFPLMDYIVYQIHHDLDHNLFDIHHVPKNKRNLDF
jgi:hypothetical protein